MLLLKKHHPQSCCFSLLLFLRCPEHNHSGIIRLILYHMCFSLHWITVCWLKMERLFSLFIYWAVAAGKTHVKPNAPV